MIPFGPGDLLLAWVIDLALGDPPALARWHPVVLIGRFISILEKILYRRAAGPLELRLRGGILFLLVAGAAGAAGWGVPALLHRLHPWAGHLGGILIAWTCLATRDLDRQVRRVVRLLEMDRVEEARRRLGRIVGRDTEDLPPSEVLRAAFETTAESTSDGVVAPLFYLALGGVLNIGPALGIVYKAANTLDSMVGYRDERYENFGKVSARMDDLLNWVPARLTALLAAFSAQFLFASGLQALRVARRDAGRHDSPNAGWPEASFAGAVGVQVGGVNRYGGVEKRGPLFGDAAGPLKPAHVRRALTLTWTVSLLTLVFAALALEFAR
jgi:adenosylcobinamide-phosphate synthase